MPVIPLARQSGGISSPPIKTPILFVAATVCGEAGFCHEDLFMSDSAMPTGCAGGLVGASTQMVVLETHPASGRLVAPRNVELANVKLGAQNGLSE